MANGSNEEAKAGAQQQLASSGSTINHEDFDVLIDLLGTSDAEVEESIVINTKPDISHPVEDLIGLDMSVNYDAGHSDMAMEPAQAGRGADGHEQVPVQHHSHRAEDISSRGEASMAAANSRRQRRHKARQGHRPQNRPDNASGSHHRPVIPSLQFSTTSSATVTPNSPHLTGAEVSSLPISPLQLAPPNPLEPPPQRIGNGRNNDSDSFAGQSVDLRASDLPSEYNPNSSRGHMMDFFASSQAPITQFSQAVSEVKQQVATLKERIQKLDHDTREYAGENAYRALRKGSHPAEGPEGKLRQDDGANANRSAAYVNGADGHSANKNPEQSLHLNPDTDLTAIDVENMPGDDAKRLLSLLFSGLLDPEHDQSRRSFIPPQTVSDIQHALQLTSDLDDLVWRRSKRAAQSRAHKYELPDVYSAENIEAILERARLWERAVRGRKNRQ